MARGDDLIEEIRGLLIQRQISQFVANQKRRIGIGLQFAHERVIDLRGQQMIQHVHGRRKQHAVVGLAGARADDFRQEGFTDARYCR